jgi:hypothetical protein
MYGNMDPKDIATPTSDSSAVKEVEKHEYMTPMKTQLFFTP